MENQTDAQARALEPTLDSPASPASRRAVVQLARLPPALKEIRLMCYAQWDLGNLVRCALAAAASANARLGEDDLPVLCFAAQYGTARALKALLTGGADVQLADKDGYTALHWASHKGYTPCVSLLLDAGAPLEARDGVGRTALALAATEGHSQVLSLLLERGAAANTVTLGPANTPLMSAVMGKHLRCVELLLPHSDLSITSKSGRNAFHVSVMSASYDCFKLLLPRMADVDVRTGPDADAPADTFSQTAAHIACTKGQHKMLEKLLRRGASRTARDSEQKTPLHCAAIAGQLSCIVQLIGHPEAYKMASADINAAEESGLTPLHYAVMFGHSECCGLLIAAGALLDARDCAGFTPLMVAQHFHPANTALHDLLAGRGPEHPPGTFCDSCGCVEDPASHLMPCSGCQVARYCSVVCQHAAWAAHEPECGRLKAEREENTRVKLI